MMNSMMPVWDFSAPDFDQLQADQPELIWNPLPDVSDDLQAALGLSPIVPGSLLPCSQSANSDVQTEISECLPGDGHKREHSTALPQRDKVNVRRRPAALTITRHDNASPNIGSPDTSSPHEQVQEATQRQRVASLDNSERSKAVNRESQRRFRLRQKVLWVPHSLVQDSTLAAVAFTS